MAALPKVQANLLDRAIAVVSPGWAKARMRDRAAIAVAGGYFGGGGRGLPRRDAKPARRDDDELLIMVLL